MNEQSFVERRETDWQRLSKLCDRADTSPAQLAPAELRDLVRLYRRASTDLAVARTRSTNLQLIEFLNDLVGRAYGIVYRAPRQPLRTALLNAIALSAQTVRRRAWFVLVSALLFFGSAFVAFGILQSRPDVHDIMVPPMMDKAFESWKSGKFPEKEGSTGVMMTGFYASNNPRTSIVAGSLGAASFGALSIYLLIQNGSMLGTLSSELVPVGKVDFLLSSVSPHGVPELSGIIVSGSAGLLFGWALINPGRRSRGEALREVGKDGIVLLGTSVILMFIAAPIEGFFSFNAHVPGWLKVTVAAVSLAAWLAFWSGYAKEPTEPAADR